MRKLILISLAAILAAGLSAQEVKWYTFEEAVELSKKEPKKILIDVYTDWCGWCKRMDQTTFSNAVVAKYMNENYYPVKFDAEQKDSVVYKGQTFRFIASGARGIHELAYSLLNGNPGYPSIVFLDEKTEPITLYQSYADAKQFDMIIKFIGDDHYKTKKWEEWASSYESPIN